MQEYILYTPVASMILVFTLVTSVYAFSNPELFGKFMLHPYSVARRKNVHTVLTSGIIHRDWMHLAFNMLTFFFFAFPLERVLAQLSSWGHAQFFLIYLLALILSDVPTIFRHKNNYGYHSLGASGAISAVLFSYILFNPTMSLYLFFIPIPIPAIIFGPLYLVYCAWASNAARDTINHDAHLYGALTGLALTILLYPGIIPVFIEQVRAML